jgi:formylglycine-generating enzyme required for sulfatase activity
MPKIAISYRRTDSDATGRIFDRLVQKYGKDSVFRDIDNIPFGIDFRKVVNDALQDIDVLIAIVGPNWRGARRFGGTRINEPNDLVRIEVETALQRDIPVVPVLIGGVDMPKARELPGSLQGFSFRNAASIESGRNFDTDVERLMRSIDRLFEQEQGAKAQRQAAAKEAAEREQQRGAEEERRSREFEAGQREKERPQAEEKRKVEEERGRKELERKAREQREAEERAWKEQRIKEERERQARELKEKREPAPEESRRAAPIIDQGRNLAAVVRETASPPKPWWSMRRTMLIASTLAVAAIGVWLIVEYWPSSPPPVATAQQPPPVATAHPATASVPLSPERERALKPKDSFKECATCPEMVVMPAGSFTMGSPANELERLVDEGPQHPVKFAKSFAVGRFSVTFDEWDACVSDGGCNGYRPGDAGWGRGLRPVINVSWHDAQTYVVWLSKKTGNSYRLLSEAEREYVTRAGTSTPFWWGDNISPDVANYNSSYSYAGSSKGRYRQRTEPADSFSANPWGLYNVAGNVWEWTQDCYDQSYRAAPADGSAWIQADCSRRVLRGGSWDRKPWFLRSAARLGWVSSIRDNSFGMRVARTLHQGQ